MLKDLVKFIALIIFSVLYRVELIGRENIPPKGAAIICANHLGELDMFFMGYRVKRLIHYMAKQELFVFPIGPILKRIGAFPVKRGKGDVSAIKTSLKLLKEGHILGIFPEGSRLKNRVGKSLKIKPGVALLAQKTGAPIIPVAVSGSYKPFSKIKVIFGEPFRLDLDVDRKYTNNELVEASEIIMKNVYSLLEVE